MTHEVFGSVKEEDLRNATVKRG